MMVRPLGEVRLKSGEKVHRLVVEAPDEEWAPVVRGLLAHKGWHYRWHIERALQGPLEGLETRFYLGLLGFEAVTNIMVVEARGVGIVGHVYTRPEHRRKGIATAVMEAQMEDFRQRGGRALTLGTGYDTPPYWIYHSFGFRSVAEGSGTMWCFTRPQERERLWQAPVRGPSEIRWEHWPLLNLLCVQPEGDFLRHQARSLWGQRNFEGGFLAYKHQLALGSVEGRVLENEEGLVVGWASVEGDPLWREVAALLDLFLHPVAWPHAETLLAALPLPSKPILAYAQEGSPKEEVLARWGFRRLTLLPRWLSTPQGQVGVSLWLRMP